MHTPIPARWRRQLVMLLAVALAPALHADALPDLLDLPAARDARASHSVQLAIARAGQRLVSVGERGIVLLSDDDGKSWRQAQHVPVSVALTNLAFASANTGWATGHSGVVLRSDDGGERWRVQLTGTQAAGLVLEEAQRRVAQLESAAGQDAAGPTDAARDEAAAARALRDAQRLVEEGADKPLLALAFADENHGWVAGAYGLALATQDGGESWHSIVGRIPNRGARHLYAIRHSQGRLLMAGEQGLLIRSDDAGETFAAVESPYDGTFFGVLEDGLGLIAYGLRGNAWAQDGEGAWSQLEAPQPVTFTAALRRADGSLVLADEAGHLYARAADGAAFQALAIQAPTGLTGLAESADGKLVACATRGALRLANGDAP